MSDDDKDGSERTFSKGELARAVNAAVREATAKVEARFADYDDLKKQADEAGKSKSQIEKLSEQITTLTDRAAKSDRAVMVREAADKLGISPKKAARLTGNTVEELIADGEDFFDIKAGENNSKDEGDGDSGSGRQQQPERQQREPEQQAPARGRPRESLTPGAPAGSSNAPQETNPAKLAAAIPRH